GGGGRGVEEGVCLARRGRRVTVVHRRDAFRASKIMVDRALANDRVHVRWNAVVEEVVGDGRVEGVRVRDVVTGETETIPAAAMFVAIGHTPNTELFRGQLELDPDGYIVADGSRTNVAGVFVAGDVQDRQYKQAVTAAGGGCIAESDAERWLELGQALETDQARTASAATGN